MATKAEALTQAQFNDEVLGRLEKDGQEISKSQYSRVLAAICDEAADCLANGYSISIGGLVKLEPRAKAGRKKGTVVRNPFDGSEKKLRADEPDKITIKARPLAKAKAQLPTPNSKAGKELVKALS